MKLIVGLGNPGKTYENTRHNMGFITIDKYASINNVEINKNKFNGLYCDFMLDNEKIILLKPQSYINLSGEVIKKYVDYFNIKLDDILIISDDLDLNFGSYKLKANGSSGGHNGLKNIELHLGTSNYKRLKLGISNNKMIDTKDYVLSKFNNEDREIINKLEEEVQEILKDYLKINFDLLMTKYNKKNR